MTYLYAGCGVAFIAALILFGWVLYRAGRNAARVQSECQDVSDATQTTDAAKRMLEARTNGLRSENALIGDLDKGTF